MKRLAAVGVALCLVMSGCGNQASTEPEEATKKAVHQEQEGQQAKPQKPSATTPATYKVEDVDQRLVKAHSRFAFELFREVVQEEREQPNVFISPFSAAVALSMTMNGAEGETLEGMQEALQLKGLSLEEVNRGNEVLADVLMNDRDGIELAIANSLWADEGLDFKKPFLTANQTHYDAELAAVDLQTEQAKERINEWVDEKTHGKIEKLLEEPLSDDAIMLLMNAIYFDGSWVNPFPEERTEKRPFSADGGNSTEVSMMFLANKKLQYMNEDGVQGVRLPYHGGASMIVLLPEAGTDWNTWAADLTEERWNKWKGAFREAQGTVGLPKFTIEYDVTLNKMLEAIGMGVALHPEEANFDNMIDHPTNVFISKVQQKTYVDVGEQGTVAAAVTGITMGTTSAPSELFELEVNRPFFFAIEDQHTGTILFMGKVEAPKTK